MEILHTDVRPGITNILAADGMTGNRRKELFFLISHEETL